VARQVYERVEGPREVDFLAQLGDLYPGSSQPGETNTYLGPLTPDLLGESLVATVLRHRDTSPQFVEEVTRGGVENAIQQACTVLGQLGARHEFDPVPWIKQLLEGDFAGRVDPALKAAQSLGEETTAAPVGRVLAEVCQRSGSVELAARLEREIPEQTVSLRELGLWVAETLVSGLDVVSTDEHVLAKRARLLSKLGYRQSELGQREAALSSAEEAVKHYQALAATRPDALLPYLAGSLSNLGARQSELGHREAALSSAEEAVKHYRALAATSPDVFLPYLSGSLNNLGSMQGKLG
ncbi:MAG: hypothetical protein ACKO3P_21935, partial [Planctomycetaceae bacterium]